MALQRLRQIAGRFQRMDREELYFRLRQEVCKRTDGVLARLGVDFSSIPQNQTPLKPGSFFFSAHETDARLAVLRERLPDQLENIIERADRICQHHFDLLGYTALKYGNQIDWHLDAVHGKRARRKLFYRVPYLDFCEVGDSKITWELNRHQHLVTLAKAYRITGNERYADEALRQWRDWAAENPYAIGINWASSLEVGFRSLSWIWMYHLLLGSKVPEFRNEWLRRLSLHGRHIERYISKYFSPNTHLLGEGVALFFLGVLCPELPAANRWKSIGWEIILSESERQVQADGFHFEQSTYYHVYALDMFLHSAILAGLNGILLPATFEKTLQKMLDTLCLLGRCGSPPRFGDDDGGRLFDPARNRGENLLDPLAAGAILFRRGDYKSVASYLCEETIWLFGPEGVREWDALASTAVCLESTALHNSGLYLLAGRPGTQMVFDAGPQGTQSGGHGHADALSVCLQSNGHPILIDPGTFEYVGEDHDRDLFRGTSKHNTLNVDEQGQAEPTTPFSWRRLTQTTVERWIQGESFDLLIASHDGYQRLPQPLTHRRCVFSVRNDVYLIRDVIEGTGWHELEVCWNLGPDLEFLRENVFAIKGTSGGLAILPANGQGWHRSIRQEAWSPVYGRKELTTSVRFRRSMQLPGELAILLLVLEDLRGGPGSFEAIIGLEAKSNVSAYAHAADGGRTVYCFGEGAKPWNAESISSDAEFVCWERKLVGEELLIQTHGSYTEVSRGIGIRCRQNVPWCEVSASTGGMTVRSSNPEALDPLSDVSSDTRPVSRDS